MGNFINFILSIEEKFALKVFIFHAVRKKLVLLFKVKKLVLLFIIRSLRCLVIQISF